MTKFKRYVRESESFPARRFRQWAQGRDLVKIRDRIDATIVLVSAATIVFCLFVSFTIWLPAPR